jgi:hypothetical protein
MARASSPSLQKKKRSRKAMKKEIAKLRYVNQQLQGASQANLYMIACTYRLLEQARRARDDLEEARANLGATDTTDLIPRPRGSPGDRRRGYILIDALGLRSRYNFFKALRVRDSPNRSLFYSLNYF